MTRRSSSSDPEPTPSSVSESDGSDNLQEYQYESEGEKRLGESACRLYQASGRDYRLARASILAYTRNDLVYRPAPEAPVPRRARPRVRTFCQPTLHTVGTGFVAPPPDNASPDPSPDPEIVQPPVYLPQEGVTRGTLILPLLIETGMQDYFQAVDGVSSRSVEDVRCMLRHIKRDQQWVGDILYVDTSAVTVTDQQIHKPVRGAVSDTWYIITAGTRVGVFTSWSEVAPYTQGIRNATHRSCSKRSNAFSYFQNALMLGTVRLLPIR